MGQTNGEGAVGAPPLPRHPGGREPKGERSAAIGPPACHSAAEVSFPSVSLVSFPFFSPLHPSYLAFPPAGKGREGLGRLIGHPANGERGRGLLGESCGGTG